MDGIPACQEEGDTEGSKTSILSVGMLIVAYVLYELFDGDGMLELVFIPPRTETCLVDEGVSVGGKTCHAARYVGREWIRLVGRFRCGQERRRSALLRGQHDSIGR